MKSIKNAILIFSLLTCAGFSTQANAGTETPMAFIDRQISMHAGQTGAYVLDRGEGALQARAWLVDHAQQSIEVQYFKLDRP